MSGHTAGPWEFHPVQSTSVGTERIMAKSDHLDYVFVADVYPPHNDQISVYGERDANARLIAAAPDLLAALKGLASYAYSIVNPALLPSDYQAAVRAIDKAEGRTS